MWTIGQENAINKNNSNVLVSASAGSGKTSVLITRVIKKVLEEQIDIDKILVVTFTNAAALELKQRLEKELNNKLKSNASQSSFIKRQIRLLNRANISTLHSFCLKIIRENFDVLEIDPDFKISDESESSILKSKAINKVLEKEYSKENNKDLYNLLELFNNKEENVVNELFSIYSYVKSFVDPYIWLSKNIEKYNEENIDNLYDLEYGKNIYDSIIFELNLVISKIAYQIKELEKYEDFDKTVEVLKQDLSNINYIINSSNNSWDSLYENLGKIEFKNLPRYNGNNILLKEDVADFRKNVIKETIKKCKKNMYSNTNKILEDNKKAYPYLKYIYFLIEEFEKEYSKQKRNKNLIDFSDIEHMAYKVLYDEDKISDVSLSLKKQFVEVYIDEYQDISYIQEAILKVVSNENNRFMVGDIKQSIYKFRQAVPEIFNKKSEEYNLYNGDILSKNDTKIVLSDNFRSRQEVISSINFIFENIMSKEAGGCNYSGIDTLKCAASYEKIENQNYKTELNVINLKKEEDLELDEELESLKDFEIEAFFIAKRIKELVGSTIIYEKNVGQRKASYKDIVILIRNVLNKANILENVLKTQGIPAFSDTSSNIFDSEEVNLVLSFLRVLDNKYQDIYLIALMYSVVGDFSLDELVNIRSLDKNCSFYDCFEKYLENGSSIVIKNKLLKFIETLKYYENLSKKVSISELLLEIYHKTGIYYQFILDESSKQRIANLDLILNMAVKFEENDYSTISEYISYIDSMSNKVDTSNMTAKVIGENEDAVRIMTIHKSKGLEFPIVILADTSRKYNYKEINENIVLHKDLGIGINVTNSNYKVSYPSVIKQAIKEQIIKDIKDEELRILYVALTRAKEKLIIFGTTKDYNKLYSNLFIMEQNSKIDPYVVLKNDSYLKNILMVLKKEENYSEYIDFNLIKFNYEINTDNNKINVDFLKNISNIKDKYNNDEINLLVKDIKQEVNSIKYNQEEELLPQRISVSQLKSSDNNIKFELPTCIDEKSGIINSARKGTLVHFILQILDFNRISTKQELINFINEKLENNVINNEDKKAISIDAIYDFLMSPLGQAIKKSNKVYKEKEFILKNNSFIKSSIQGIIDLYFIDLQDRLILVDFKTDNMDSEQEFIDKYLTQLKVYKEALEKLTKKKVYKTYIYSFKLSKEIEV